MEPYSSQYCGAAVIAFLNGWVNEIQANKFSAGVYGSPANAATDWLSVSPHPDDVWLATYNKNYDLVTIWGISGTGYNLDDSYWAHDQRIRQYYQNRFETWGGVQLQIDPDVIDATVVGGNGVKSYTFTTSTFDYPGAVGTLAAGIKNALNGQLGTIVGQYIDTAYNRHGFIMSGGTLTSFDCAPNSQTRLYGINNEGVMVGQYVGSDGFTHGFSYSGTSCTSIDYPGALATAATAINDAGWITGTYADSSGVYHSFVYKNGQFSSFDYPGATPTEALGLNGLGQITGTYGNPYQGFLDNAGSSDPNNGSFSTITAAGGGSTFVGGINNNAQIVGISNNAGFLLNGGSFVPIPSATNGLLGINDETQLVGGPGDSHGFVAIPQH